MIQGGARFIVPNYVVTVTTAVTRVSESSGFKVLHIQDWKFDATVDQMNNTSELDLRLHTYMEKILYTVSCVPRINLRRKKDSSYVLDSWSH